VEDWTQLEGSSRTSWITCARVLDPLRGRARDPGGVGCGVRSGTSAGPGLDYYVKTSFEVIHHAGLGRSRRSWAAAVTTAPRRARGRADPRHRVRLRDRARAPGLRGAGTAVPVQERPPVFVVTLGETAACPAEAPQRPEAGGGRRRHRLPGRSMKAQMRAANRSGSRVALILVKMRSPAGRSH